MGGWAVGGMSFVAGPLYNGMENGLRSSPDRQCFPKKILLPLARQLEEGRGTTEAGKVHKQVVPQPPWEPPSPEHPNRGKNT